LRCGDRTGFEATFKLTNGERPDRGRQQALAALTPAIVRWPDMSDGLTIHREETDGVVGEGVFGAPHPALREHVVRYNGWSAYSDGVQRRRHAPGAIMPIVIMLGPQIGSVDDLERRGPATYGDGFFAGMHDRYAVTESMGSQLGIQVDVTPITGYLLLGHDVSDLTNHSIGLSQVFGVEGRDLRERLLEEPDWGARFRIIDTFIARRLAKAKPASPAVAWAWKRLRETNGAATVNELANSVGWSRKHLAARFREQIGLAPKTVGRIVRFQGVVQALREGVELGWSDLAYRSGYYDQAHFNRDFREYTGLTPSEYITRLRPDGLED
jgi:AraC-like DNA-binding protein